MQQHRMSVSTAVQDRQWQMHAGWMLERREVSERCRVYYDCRRCQLLRLSQRLHDQI